VLNSISLLLDMAMINNDWMS